MESTVKIGHAGNIFYSLVYKEGGNETEGVSNVWKTLVMLSNKAQNNTEAVCVLLLEISKFLQQPSSQWLDAKDFLQGQNQTLSIPLPNQVTMILFRDFFFSYYSFSYTTIIFFTDRIKTH